LNLLLRAQIELPEGLRLMTEEFREGWNISRSVDARCIEKKLLNRGWNFIKIAGGSLRSGVGDTSQEAIANALKLALRRTCAHSNAVEVEHIELTEYPWFFLARVRINPFRIQQGAVLPVSDETLPLPLIARQRRLPRQSAALYPHYGSSIPMLKEMLILSRSTHERAQ
jgi:hypothetical protein